MKQLSGLDASFLYMETGSQFGHVSSLSIYQRPDDPDYEPLSSWRHQIERRLHLLEPLRRRLPVSIRTGEETEKWTNRVSSIFATLPTDEPDPLQRVLKVHEAMVGAKELFDAVPATR